MLINNLAIFRKGKKIEFPMSKIAHEVRLLEVAQHSHSKVDFSHKCVVRRMSWFLWTFLLKAEFEDQCLIIILSNGKQKVTESVKSCIRDPEEMWWQPSRKGRGLRREERKEQKRRHIQCPLMNMFCIICWVYASPSSHPKVAKAYHLWTHYLAASW